MHSPLSRHLSQISIFHIPRSHTRRFPLSIYTDQPPLPPGTMQRLNQRLHDEITYASPLAYALQDHFYTFDMYRSITYTTYTHRRGTERRMPGAPLVFKAQEICLHFSRIPGIPLPSFLPSSLASSLKPGTYPYLARFVFSLRSSRARVADRQDKNPASEREREKES